MLRNLLKFSFGDTSIYFHLIYQPSLKKGPETEVSSKRTGAVLIGPRANATASRASGGAPPDTFGLWPRTLRFGRCRLCGRSRKAGRRLVSLQAAPRL